MTALQNVGSGAHPPPAWPPSQEGHRTPGAGLARVPPGVPIASPAAVPAPVPWGCPCPSQSGRAPEGAAEGFSHGGAEPSLPAAE